MARVSRRDSGFDPRPVPLGFVMDKMTLGKVSVRALQFIPVSTIPPIFALIYLSPSLYNLTDRQRR
jgi:branched-subunit amino acid transport protein